MPRLKITLAYQGTHYAGWQMQPITSKARPSTIQGELEKSLAAIVGERVVIHGSGRTDAGVHAEAQVCHCDIPSSKSSVNWLRALNVLLPLDIRILAVEEIVSSFHALRSAKLKRYCYSLWLQHGCLAVPRIQEFVWSTSQLDLAKMSSAANLLTGRHDFASFQNSGSDVQDTVRHLLSITQAPGRVAKLICPPDWPVISFIFEGEGFLRQMVRNLMGLLVWIGQGKLDEKSIPEFLAARKRQALPSPTAPASGLTLLEVIY